MKYLDRKIKHLHLIGKIIKIKYVNGIENYLPTVAVSDLISSSSSVVVGVGGSHRHLRFRKTL